MGQEESETVVLDYLKPALKHTTPQISHWRRESGRLEVTAVRQTEMNVLGRSVHSTSQCSCAMAELLVVGVDRVLQSLLPPP